uniref:Uncharacterized protein n=1 Tax=Anopheles melas TaxID=34690 RepID=A0A182TG53_9DIPT
MCNKKGCGCSAALNIDSATVYLTYVLFCFAFSPQTRERSSGSNWFTRPHSRRKSGKKVKVTFSDQLDTTASDDGSGGSVPSTSPSPFTSAQARWRYLEQIFVPPSPEAVPNRSSPAFDRTSSLRQSGTSYASVGSSGASSGPYNRRPPPQRKVGQKMADCEKEEALNLVSK